MRDAGVAWASDEKLAHKLSLLLTDRGIPQHQQTALLTKLCGLSTSQARRKWLGATWSFQEVTAVAKYLNVSLDRLFGDEQVLVEDHTVSAKEELRLAASLRIGQISLPCSILLGPRLSGRPGKAGLVAVMLGDAWHVGECAEMEELVAQGMAFQVEELLVCQESVKMPCLAFLDDDADAVAMLAEWFTQVGYRAEAFSASQALLAQPLEQFDAFVVDFLLAGGHSAHEVINEIRERFPHKPIVVLTGKLQDGTLSESDLIPTLRTMNVLFFEKPVRPSVLAAALQNAIDQSGVQAQP